MSKSNHGCRALRKQRIRMKPNAPRLSSANGAERAFLLRRLGDGDFNLLHRQCMGLIQQDFKQMRESIELREC